MAKVKTFNVTYRCTIERAATIKATSLEQAHKKFDEGEFKDEHIIDCQDIEVVSIWKEEE